MLTKFSKYQIATAIAILFHVIGFIGIVFFNSKIIIQSTPINLVLMLTLIIWTQEEKNKFFWLFLISIYCIGMIVEIFGTNTKLFFGDYTYGNTLGYKIKNVPILIGINWFIIIYCCGISINMFLQSTINKLAAQTKTPPIALKAISIIVDGATLAVFFDWLMEPVAVQLNYWKWKGEIPASNYFCWFVIAGLTLAIFNYCIFIKQNKFAVNLLLIQAMFFLLLQTFFI